MESKTSLTIDFILDSVLPHSNKQGNLQHTSQEVRRIALREYLQEYSTQQNSELKEELEVEKRYSGEMKRSCDLMEEERDKLLEFKRYVHNRLDKMGIPSDPEAHNNSAHGCRIEGRLNVISALQEENERLKTDFDKYRNKWLNAEEENERLRKALERIYDECNRPYDEPCNIYYIELQADKALHPSHNTEDHGK